MTTGVIYGGKNLWGKELDLPLSPDRLRRYCAKHGSAGVLVRPCSWVSAGSASYVRAPHSYLSGPSVALRRLRCDLRAKPKASTSSDVA